MKLSSFDSSFLKAKAYTYANNMILQPARIATSAAISALITTSSKGLSMGFGFLCGHYLSLIKDSYYKAKKDFPACAAANTVRDFIVKGPDELKKEYWDNKSLTDLLSISYIRNLYKDLTNIPGKTPTDSEFLKRAKYICKDNSSENLVKEKLLQVFNRLTSDSEAFQKICNTQTPETCAATLLPAYWEQCIALSTPSTPPPTTGFFANAKNVLTGFVDTNFLKPNADAACAAYSADVDYMLVGVYALTALGLASLARFTFQNIYQTYIHSKNPTQEELEKRLATLEQLLISQKTTTSSINPELEQEIEKLTTQEKPIIEPVSPKESLEEILKTLLLKPSINAAG